MLALCSIAFAGSPKGYRIVASCPFGEFGRLQLLLDERVSPDVLESHWGTGPWEGPTPKPALLLWKTRNNEVKATLTLEHPLARLADKSRVVHEPPRITVDFSAGFGSYNGPITRWIVPENGQLAWARVADSEGRFSEISVMESLKTSWRRVIRGDGTLDVLEIACRPEFMRDDSETVDFKKTFTRYHFDGKSWTRRNREESGMWENWDEPFPPESSFP